MKTLQNFFKTTIPTAWAAGTGNRYVTTLPTPTSGWLVVSPNNASLREIVRYTATGSDGGGNYITIAERGIGGTTDQAHAVSETVRMNITAEHWADIYVDPVFTGDVTVPTPTNGTDAVTKDYADGLAIAGAPDATTSTKGITKMSVAPVSAASPIAVGDNDGRVPTQGENDALVGTSGTPSTSNKFVTNDDTATAATASKVVRRGASGEVTVPTTPTATTDATSKAYVDSSSGAVNTTGYVLGESFTGATTPQPCYVVNDLYQYGITGLDQGSASSNSFGMDGSGANIEFRALKIIPKANVTIASIRLYLGKVGAPTDNALIEIQTDSAGSPSGTPVSNGTSGVVAGTALSTTVISELVLTFATPPALTAGTTYWVVFKRSSTVSNVNYYITSTLRYDMPYGSFGAKSYISGAWSSSTDNGNLPYLELTPATGSSLSLWKTDSDSTLWLPRQFFGWCTTTGSANDVATLVKKGSLSGFTGLTIGTDYYTSTTAGSYTATGGGVYVGTATSSTQLDIPSIKYGCGLLEGGMLAGFKAVGSTFTSAAGYKLPFNGFFTYYGDTVSSAVASIDVYMGNTLGAMASKFRFFDSNGPVDAAYNVPYVRGTYICPILPITNVSWTIRFTPIIE